MRILVVDNYDSFVFNLVQYLGQLGVEAEVWRNDDALLSDEAAIAIGFDGVLLSPGPGTPERAGASISLVRACAAARTPLLGVCLGHQGLALAAGAQLIPAPEVMHGRPSQVFHDGSALFASIPQGFSAMRYHSLVVARPLPPCLQMTAWTENGVIMGLRHTERPLWGVQFHPESIGTEHGKQMLTNFREVTRRWKASRGA